MLAPDGRLGPGLNLVDVPIPHEPSFPCAPPPAPGPGGPELRAGDPLFGDPGGHLFLIVHRGRIRNDGHARFHRIVLDDRVGWVEKVPVA